MDIIKQLRQQAEEIAKEGHAGWGNTMLEAADRLERNDIDLWAIDAELRRAGLKPWKYKTFAECVAFLRERAQQAVLTDTLPTATTTECTCGAKTRRLLLGVPERHSFDCPLHDPHGLRAR